MNQQNRAWAEKVRIRLDLSGQSADVAALIQGWSHPETYGSWAIGCESQLRVPIPSDSGDVSIRLMLRPFTAAENLVSQRLQIGVDGRVLGHYELADWSSIECRIPRALTRERSDVTLRLSHPDAASPFSQGLSEDVRLLAFMLRAVEIAPADTDMNDQSMVIVFEGDSLSLGVGADFHARFQRSGMMISNQSVSGATLRERLGSYDSEISMRYGAATGLKLMHLGAGSNDLRSADDPPSIYDQLKTLVGQFCAKAREDGFTIIVATVLPRIDIVEQREDARLSFNHYLRSEWPAFADGLVDWAADPVLGSPHFSSSDVFCADGIHPTLMGYRRLGEISKAAVDIAIRSTHSRPWGKTNATLPSARDGAGQMIGNFVATDAGLADEGARIEIVNVDFGPEGNFSQFQSGGFSGQEASGIWSLGDESWILIPVASMSRRLELHIWVQPCLVPGLNRRQILSVSANGIVIGLQTFESAEWVRQSFDLSDAIKAGDTLLRLSFRYPEAVSPSQSGSSTDTRRLAFMFKTLAVVDGELPPSVDGPQLVNGAVADEVHEGNDGWLFLVGGTNQVLRYFRDSTYFTELNADRWADLLISRRDRLRARGVRYLHIAAPDKITVYPDYFGQVLPNFDRHPVALLSRRLRDAASDDVLIDPLDAFLNSPDRDRLYLKTDTHWSYRAGQIVLQLVTKRLGEPRHLDLSSRSLTFYNHVWDLGSKVRPSVSEQNFAVATRSTVRRVHANSRALAFERNVRAGEPVSHGSIYTVFRNSDPFAIDQVVAIFGDSFMDFQDSNTTTIFAENFKEVHFIWSASIDFQFVSKIGANIVITELAERFMIALPADDYAVEID